MGIGPPQPQQRYDDDDDAPQTCQPCGPCRLVAFIPGIDEPESKRVGTGSQCDAEFGGARDEVEDGDEGAGRPVGLGEAEGGE